MRRTGPRKVGACLALVGALAVAALTVSGTAAAVSEPSPLALEVICYEDLGGGPALADRNWRVHFGYSSTAAVPYWNVVFSFLAVNADTYAWELDWSVDSGTDPVSYTGTGFPDTDGSVVEAFTAVNNPGKGDDDVAWIVIGAGTGPAYFNPESLDSYSLCGGAGGAENEPRVPPRGGYCSAAGNTVGGNPVPPGTFLNLLLGQPSTDPNYAGAAPAIYVDGIGLTCDPPPAGYAAASQLVNNVGGNGGPGDAGAIYPFFAKR